MGKYKRQWKIDNVFPGIESDEFKNEIKNIEKDIDKFIKETMKLPDIDKENNTAQTWENFIKKLEDFFLRLTQLSVYISCKISVDAENEKLMTLVAKIQMLGSKVSPIEIQIASLFKKCDENTFNTFINNGKYLKEIEFALREIRKRAKFNMDDEREKLVAKLSNDGIKAWGRLYNKISGKLKIELMEKGEVIKKSVGQVTIDSENRQIRENEFFASLKAWEQIKDVCAEALNHIAGTRLTLYKERGFNHFLDKPLIDNRLKRESLDAMWQAVSERKEMLKKYFNLKAKKLGIKKLSWYDQSAPMMVSKIDFDSAMDIVIEQFGKFNPEMGKFAKDAIQSGFVESENRLGKRQGAYCTKFQKRKEPRVFMTFTDSVDSMSTLAHELGHAYHSYVLKDRPFALTEYVMSTAETASTFAEAIISDYLIENAKNDNEKLAMLDKSISEAMIMMMNIHARYIFEYNFYEKRVNGELTPDELTGLMLDAQKEAFLGLLEEYNPLFWASKLHFYISKLSFYNFPYTFGYLFSNALYGLSKERGKDFVETYKNILISTGCMNTEDVISTNLGMDITKKDFWNKSLDQVEAKINQFIKIAEK